MARNPSGAAHPLRFMLAWVLLGFGLERLWSLPFPSSEVLSVGGRALWALGAVAVFWAQFEFWKHKTTDGHTEPTTALITRGPFRLSRNPVYLGFAAAMVGAAVVYKSLYAVILAIPVMVAIHRLTVVPEEVYLEREFGETYRDYKRRVRRWL